MTMIKEIAPHSSKQMTTSSPTTTLLITLHGLLQNYAYQPTLSISTTQTHPSKAAIVGLLAAAMGIKRGEDLSHLNDLQMAVRIDQAGQKMTEFQTIQYVKNFKTGATSNKLQRHEYLQDAVFVVALTGNENLLKQVEFALHHPVFPLYLGHKACVPHDLETKIVTGEGVKVLSRLPWQARPWFKQVATGDHVKLQIVTDGSNIRESSLMTDEPDCVKHRVRFTDSLMCEVTA